MSDINNIIVTESLKQTVKQNKDLLLQKVNSMMMNNSETAALIGGEINIPTMLDQQRNHIAYMNTVLLLGDFSLLFHTLPWVYRAYHNQGFRYDYFLAAFKLWRLAAEQTLTGLDKEELVKIYELLIEKHSRTIALSQQLQTESWPTQLPPLQEKLLASLISGRQKDVFSIVNDYLAKDADIADFYLNLIQPVMYQIGKKWELGEISVAEEHLASAIVSRILASFYQHVKVPDAVKGKMLITSAPNEFHEIGAWMIANMFELDGWDVHYLGANTPTKDVIAILKSFSPDVLGISITMAFNLDQVIDLVNHIKEDQELSRITVFLGGYLLRQFPELATVVHADYIAYSFEDARNKADEIADHTNE